MIMGKYMKDLAPNIYRQILRIEATLYRDLEPAEISMYLTKLSDVLKMEATGAPNCILAEDSSGNYIGWAGNIHWTTSGCHFYLWFGQGYKKQMSPTWQRNPFISIICYTCKQFSDMDAISFTKGFFGSTIKEIEWSSI